MANSDATPYLLVQQNTGANKRPFIPKLRRDRPAEPQVRTDTYQLGALLLVMLTGKYLNQGGIHLLENREDVAGRLAETIQRCLPEDRSERFQSVATQVRFLNSQPWSNRENSSTQTVLTFVGRFATLADNPGPDLWPPAPMHQYWSAWLN